MGRDTEESVIAASLVLVAGVTAVGWYAWIVTTARPAGVVPLLVLGSIATTLASVPAAVIGVVLGDRFDRGWAMLARSAALAVLTGVFAATGYVLLWGVDLPLLLVGTVVALLSVWVLVPLAVGAVGAIGGGASMTGVLLAWPPSNLLALVLFVAPGPGGVDVSTGNAFALTEPGRSLLLLCVVAVATFGPAGLGRLIDRLITVPADGQAA